jgi:hypothetical protein
VNPALQACVIVPAKNEAEHLFSTLQALAGQTDLAGNLLVPDGWEVLLLINNSTDHSVSVARHFQQAHPRFPLHIAEYRFPAPSAHVGQARKLLMDCACERLSRQPKPSSLILSTDADTEVSSNWVAHNLEEARQGAQAIGGRIRIQPKDRQSLHAHTQKIQLRDDQYHLLLSWLEDQCDPQAHDPWPRHHQHFGSSFAVTPSAYRQVGGLPAKESLEDVALHEALIRQDMKFRHSPKVRVRTAGRLQGRTPVGLAEQLSRWSQGPAAVMVPSVLFWRTFFSARAQLRRLWQRMRNGQPLRWSALESLSLLCGLRGEEIRELLHHRWFGAAFEKLNLRLRLERELPPSRVQQPLEQAVRQLHTLFRDQHLMRLRPSAAAVPDGIAAREMK